MRKAGWTRRWTSTRGGCSRHGTRGVRGGRSERQRGGARRKGRARGETPSPGPFRRRGTGRRWSGMSQDRSRRVRHPHHRRPWRKVDAAGIQRRNPDSPTFRATDSIGQIVTIAIVVDRGLRGLVMVVARIMMPNLMMGMLGMRVDEAQAREERMRRGRQPEGYQHQRHHRPESPQPPDDAPRGALCKVQSIGQHPISPGCDAHRRHGCDGRSGRVQESL